MSSCVDEEWLARHPGILAKKEVRKDLAHPYPPGSGPGGQSCGTCEKLRTVEMARRYFKCNVMRRWWTGGAGTDVRKKDEACLAWEPRVDKVEVLNVRNRR